MQSCSAAPRRWLILRLPFVARRHCGGALDASDPERGDDRDVAKLIKAIAGYVGKLQRRHRCRSATGGAHHDVCRANAVRGADEQRDGGGQAVAIALNAVAAAIAEPSIEAAKSVAVAFDDTTPARSTPPRRARCGRSIAFALRVKQGISWAGARSARCQCRQRHEVVKPWMIRNVGNGSCRKRGSTSPSSTTVSLLGWRLWKTPSMPGPATASSEARDAKQRSASARRKSSASGERRAQRPGGSTRLLSCAPSLQSCALLLAKGDAAVLDSIASSILPIFDKIGDKLEEVSGRVDKKLGDLEAFVRASEARATSRFIDASPPHAGRREVN